MMKFKAKIIGIGNSIGVTIPIKETTHKGLDIGDLISVEVKKDHKQR